ncbi:MAG: tRNA1(Val) (adenine(37)-N6)-methyltransferase [bacterium]
MEHSLDSIISSKFRFLQPKKGYRINIDTIILYDFVLKHATGNVLEIGSSSGVVSILLSKHKKIKKVTGVEIDPDAYELALQNLKINNCKRKVVFLNEDINRYKSIFIPQSFDTVVANPPFFKYGTGKISKKNGLKIAHHDVHLTIDTVFQSARYLLKPKGYLILLFTTYRIDEIFANKRGFNIEQIRFIHRKVDMPADTFLILARKGGGKQLKIIPPLIVHDNNGYSKEVINMLNHEALF